jgi:hypothetical protein
MAASDSFVGDGLNPSPYKEALAERDALRAERDALRGLLLKIAVDQQIVNNTSWPAIIDAALAKEE